MVIIKPVFQFWNTGFFYLKICDIKTPGNSALIVFIKNAEKGKVKTRLANTVGDDRALKIYQALLDHTGRIAQSVDADRFLFYNDFIEKNDGWPAVHFHKLLQRGSDLGDRMKNAFRIIFQTHKKVVIIGSDCPLLTDKIINEAFEKLDEYAFVIGPATDGGYYLLGMNQFSSAVFENIEWSTSKVLAKTIKNIEDLGKSYHLLSELSDIDTEEDWKKFGWELD